MRKAQHAFSWLLSLVAVAASILAVTASAQSGAANHRTDRST